MRSSNSRPKQSRLDRLLFGPLPEAAGTPPAPRGGGRGRASAQAGWLPVRDVQGGMVALTDGSYTVVDEVGAVNLQSLATEEQDAVLGRFQELIHAVSFPVALYVQAEALRLDGYLEDLEARAREADGGAPAEEGHGAGGSVPPALGRLLRAQARFTRELVAGARLLARRHYLALRYVPGEERARRGGRREAVTDPGLAARVLRERRETAEAALGHLGLTHRPLGDGELCDLLARAGRGQSLGVPAGVDLRRREDRLLALAPGGAEERADHLRVERRLGRVVAVTGWPREGRTGALDPLFRFPGEVSAALHLLPLRPEAVVDRLQREILQHGTVVAAARQQGKPEDPYTAQALADAVALRDAYAAGQIRPVMVQVLGCLWADTQEQLESETRLLEADLAARLFTLRTAALQQREAFIATLPLGLPGPVPWRDLDSHSAAVLFPFATAEPLDAQGTLWGRNLATKSLVLVDERKLPARHTVFLAATRSGKSYAAKALATQARFAGRQVVAVDPSAHEYRRWCQALGGQYVVLAVGAETRINPCAIALPPDIEHPDEDDLRPVSQKIEYLRALVGVLLAGTGEQLSARQRAAVERVLYCLYRRFGMEDDWASIADPASLSVVEAGGLAFRPTPRPKAMPTFLEVVEALRQDGDTRELGEALEPFATGTLAVFSGQTNVDLKADLLVFNVRALVEDNPSLAPAAYFLLAGVMSERLRADWRPKLFLVDEAHNLFRDAAMAGYLERLYRQAGKHGGQVCLITQRLADLVGSMDGTIPPPAGAQSAGVCLSQSYVRLLLRQTTSQDAHHCAQIFGLAESEAAFLAGAQPGQGLLLVDRAHAAVQVRVPPELHRLITTDPDEVARIEREERLAPVRGDKDQ